MKKRLIMAGLLLSTLVNATDRPYFEGKVLTIPSIDVKSEAAVYQDVKFEYTQKNSWALLSFQRGKKIQEITQVNLIETNDFPKQVFLNISGVFNNGCQQLGQIATQITDNLIETSVFYNNEHINNPFCTMVMTPFSQAIPLPVYGLKAGTYHYNINHNFTGSFTLSRDNFFRNNSKTLNTVK
ncbi:hypothetical protein MNBD_GAMMA04-368 [hydrothermal vent metagenome]|uniref:Uncharacterized protein n=1 Tax=hydrothermal vent metagenome TaxID=652676 RepID=A0A3B0WCG0_9ZZZZ